MLKASCCYLTSINIHERSNMRNKGPEAIFNSRYDGFSCPRCRGHLNKEKTHRLCNSCPGIFPCSRVKHTCSYKDCYEVTDGLCLADDGEWESRCKDHFNETVVKCKERKKLYKTSKSRKTNAQVTGQSGKKKRIIKKGEFPGQHS